MPGCDDSSMIEQCSLFLFFCSKSDVLVIICLAVWYHFMSHYTCKIFINDGHNEVNGVHASIIIFRRTIICLHICPAAVLALLLLVLCLLDSEHHIFNRWRA